MDEVCKCGHAFHRHTPTDGWVEDAGQCRNCENCLRFVQNGAKEDQLE